MTHAPVVVLQQACGSGQVVGPQADGLPAAATVPAPQAAPGSASVHAPLVVSQQAVGWGQGCGEQDVAAGEAATAPGGQALAREHAPVVVSQHATCVTQADTLSRYTVAGATRFCVRTSIRLILVGTGTVSIGSVPRETPSTDPVIICV
jgi:hypothetical protein